MSHMVDLQNDFLRNAAQLILWAQDQGYQLTGGELHRPDWVAEINAKQGRGSKNSLHIVRLAIDLMLFKDGEYLTTTERYRPLGEYWKSLHPDNKWGGNFTRADGNHFSRGFEGRA